MKSFSQLVIFVMALPIIGFSQAKPAIDYLGVPGPLNFNNQSFVLAWSSHPQPNYYKQEYLIKGDKPEVFKKMLMVEVVTGTMTVKELVSSKLSELRQMKQTNPMVNFESFENKQTGEYMLDFLLSANDAQGRTSIVERNVYKYKTYADKKGNKGVLLFAVSERGYGQGIDKFLIDLKATKSQLVNAVSQYKLAEPSIK